MQVNAFVRKYLPLFQASADHVAPPIFDVDPQWPGHGRENNLATDRRSAKCSTCECCDTRKLGCGWRPATNEPTQCHNGTLRLGTTGVEC
jgi:hypothetical protein